MYIPDVVWEVKYPLVDGLAEACFDEFKAKVHEGTFHAKRTRDVVNWKRDMILDELDACEGTRCFDNG